jgi:hypothetical protein
MAKVFANGGVRRWVARRGLALGLIAWLGAAGATAREYWVDAAGVSGRCDDQFDGTLRERPLCSLSACLERATVPGDRCVLRAGVYTEPAVPLADGLPGAPIEVEGYVGETVELWASVPLEEAWMAEQPGVFGIEAAGPKPIALIETAPDGVATTHLEARSSAPRAGQRESRDGEVGRFIPGTWTWEPRAGAARIRLRPVAVQGDPNASTWRARVAELDLRDRKSLTYRGVIFVDTVVRLEGARDVRFDGCLFADSAGIRPSVEIQEAGPAAMPTGSEQPTSSRPGGVDLVDTTPPSGSAVDPLPLSEGGTGATTAAAARINLAAASDYDVVHRSGDEIVEGEKTFAGAVRLRDVNGTRHSSQYESALACVADIPAEGGTCEIDPNEDDATPLAETNPDLRPATLVADARRGGARWLSSMPEPTAGFTEDQVPFVFHVRWDDPTRMYDDVPGALGEWNCAHTDGSSTDQDWRNCPGGVDSWGDPQGSKQFWYSGQCNTPFDSVYRQNSLCGGPQIFQVRGPQVPGVQVDKPIFGVGSAGVVIHQPEENSRRWLSWLTIFRNSGGNGEAVKANVPMYAFTKNGLFADGGLFIGNSLGWLDFTAETYTNLPSNTAQWNAYIQHDVDPRNPGLIVEGTSSPEHKTAPMVRFYDVTGKGGGNHPQGDIAFEFGNNSRLYLGSRCRPAAPGCEDTDDDSQMIEWEGVLDDGFRSRLTATSPTANRNVKLPDASGTLVVAASPSSGVVMKCGSASVDPGLIARLSAEVATASVPELGENDVCTCVARTDHADALIPKACYGTAGTLNLRLYNSSSGAIDAPAQTVDYCCIAR